MKTWNSVESCLVYVSDDLTKSIKYFFELFYRLPFVPDLTNRQQIGPVCLTA